MRSTGLRGLSIPKLSSIIATLCFLTVVALPCMVRAQCEGQGDAVILMKGRCAAGEPLKFRLAGAPNAKFQLFVSEGGGPTFVEGRGLFCLDFNDTLVVLKEGTLNSSGFSAALSAVPEDPTLVGRSLFFQAAVKDLNQSKKVAISNAIEFPICEGCLPVDSRRGTIESFEAIGFVVDADEFPKKIAIRVAPNASPDQVIDEISFTFDPASRPTFPLVAPSNGVRILDVTAIGSHLILNFAVDGRGLEAGCLPTNTRVRIVAGESSIENVLHTSDRSPMEVGQWMSPYAITRVERVPGRTEQ